MNGIEFTRSENKVSALTVLTHIFQLDTLFSDL